METPHNSSETLEKNVAEFKEISTELKLGLVCLNLIVIFFNILALFALSNTRKLPYVTKRLLMALLIFELTFIMLSTILKFITNQASIMALHLVTHVFFRLSVQTDTMLSIERLALFCFPFWYLRTITKTVAWTLLVSLWIFNVISFASVRYGLCMARQDSMEVFFKPDSCKHSISVSVTLHLSVNFIISCFCNLKVLLIIRTKRDVTIMSSHTLLRYYKATGFVLIRFILIIFMTAGYGSILVIVNFFRFKLSDSFVNIYYQIVATIICFIDPILYIVWFKECQLNIFSLLAFFSIRFHRKAEEMRIEIFNIVISKNSERSRPEEEDLNGL